MLDSIKGPDASVAAVAKREPLINTKLERERFDAIDAADGIATLARDRRIGPRQRCIP
jgi:hypothetical protein